MCYLVGKRFDRVGSVAMPAYIGSDLSSFIDDLESRYGIDKLQLVTISRPSAYGEYEPYSFVQQKAAFVRALETQCV